MHDEEMPATEYQRRMLSDFYYIVLEGNDALHCPIQWESKGI